MLLIYITLEQSSKYLEPKPSTILAEVNESKQKAHQCRGFIKGWAPGKLTSCEDNFANLV